MKDQGKSNQQLIAELAELRRQVVALETAAADGRQAEEERRRSEAKWRSVVENAPLFVAVVDRSGKMQFLNRFQPGFDPTTVLGRPVYDFLQPQYHAVARKSLEQVLQTGERAAYECVGTGPEGSASEYVTDVGPVIVDGEIIAATLMSRDITDRKRAQKALLESEARFRSLFQDASVGTVVVSPTGEFMQVNRAFCEFLGYSEQELVGKTVLSVTHPDDRETSSKAIYQAAHAGPPLLRLEKRYLHKNGGVVWGEVSSNLICDAEGKPTYFISQVLDIGERKRAEEALQKAHDELEQRVEERTAELARANEQLAIFRQFAEASSQGFSMADFDGRLIYLNPALCRMLEVKEPEDCIGQHFSICYSAETNRRGREEIEPDLKKNGYWEGELPLLTRQGRSIPTWHNSFVIRDSRGDPLRLAVVITDIAERKAAEEALAASEERFRAAFEEAPVGMVMSGADGVIVKVNRAICEMSGFSPEDMVGHHSREFNHPEDMKTAASLVGKLFSGEVPSFTVQKRYRKKDGSFLWTELTAAGIRGPGGRVPFGLAIVQDITERKRAQEALTASENKYRLLVETTGTGYLILDGEGRVIDANAEYVRISGHHALEDILGRTVVEWTASYDVDRNAKEVEKCYRKGLVRQLEIDYVHPDGKIIPIDINATCLDTEDGRRIVCLCRDITERREAQEALRASEERYELAVRAAGVGIFDWDILTGRVYYSPRWKTLFGYEETEIGDGVEDWSSRLHPEERESITKRQDDFFTGTSPTATAEYRLRHKDGSYRWIEANVLVVRDEAGRSCRLVGSHGDITDRKQAQEALERERQALWRMLQASDHERQTISYDIHDGLAQYLAGAIMQFQACDSLRESHPDEAKTAYQTAVELVRQAHGESRRLISEVRPPVIDENGLETAIAHLVHEQRRRGGPQIEYRSAVQFGRLPSILENALYRIAQEALTNACKHSKSETVTVSMDQEGQEVRLKVQDWGIGFASESSESGHFGLEGIRQRVRLLGGRLAIKSTPGSGALVEVVVPVVERQGER